MRTVQLNTNSNSKLKYGINSLWLGLAIGILHYRIRLRTPQMFYNTWLVVLKSTLLYTILKVYDFGLLCPGIFWRGSKVPIRLKQLYTRNL